MGLIEIFLIGVSLAMAAFAVSICKGLSMKKMSYKKGIIIALYFGVFQGVMPIIGFLLGSTFEKLISNIDHWIAFVLLSWIGATLIKDAFNSDDKNCNDNVSFKVMLPLAIATSIDALIVGITFSFFDVNIILAAIIITVVTFIISLIGVKIGNVFGNKYESKAQILGGIVLILIGLKTLLEHLGIL